MSNPTFTVERFDALAELVRGQNVEDYDQRWLRSMARMSGMKFKNTKENTEAIINGLDDARQRKRSAAPDLQAGPPLPFGRKFKATADMTLVRGTPSGAEVVKNPEPSVAGVTHVRSFIDEARTLGSNVIGSILGAVKRKREEPCPPSPIPPIGRPTLPLNFAFPIAVLSDLHVPMHDAEFIDKMIDFCIERGVRGFILAGDITDNNQWHKRTHDIRTERSWQQDITLARSVLAHLCANLGPGYVFFGNHDDWILKATRGQVQTDWLYKHLFPDLPITFSFKHQVYIPRRTIGGKDWLVVHGERYSHGNPMGVVEKYALHAECNVIMGHQHYASQWKSGSYDLIMNGGLMSYERMDYMVERPQPMRKQQRGFTIIDERGSATLYTDYQTWR